MSYKHVGIFVVSVAIGCASAGSDDGGACEDNGLVGCPCIAGGLCLAGLVCDAGVCLPPGGGEEDPGETGMDGDDGKPIADMGAEDDTGPTMGSCEGLCGSQGSGECWCDPSCIGLGDCCDDYAQACPGQCLSNGDCASDEVCSAGSQSCESAYGWTYDVWLSYWADYADVCWDVGECAAPDPFYSIVLGGQVVFVSAVNDDTLIAEWYDPASILIDGSTTLYFSMEDEDISVHDWILDWGELNGQGVFTAPSLETLHRGYVVEDCWEAPLAAGTGCYELEIRFVAQ
jgi:hypothetical protein